MVSMTVELRNIAGTQAALGWAGGHTLVIDRPEGKAGGLGLGFNGGQMLALAIGGCFCNDLRYAASEAGRAITDISITVTLEMAGTPLLASGATMTLSCNMADGGDASEIIARAKAGSMVSNSLQKGVRVHIVTQPNDGAH